MAKEKVKISAFIVQASASFSIAFLTSMTGFVYAWPSYTFENFLSNSTVLSWPLSTTEVSLLGSMTNIGALVMTPFCGYAVDTFGRKYSAMLFGLPAILAWSVIIFTTYVPLVIAAIGVAGFSAAGQAVSGVYISEISQDSIRGMFTSSCVYGYYVGLLVSYALGGYLSYYTVLYAHLAMSVMYVLFVAMLRESPVFLAKMGKDEEAKRSIAFYRRVEVDSKEVEAELRKIKLQLDPRIEEILHRGIELEVAEKLMEEAPPVEVHTISPWKFLKKSKSSQRALGTTLTLISANIMMGAIVIQVYAEPLFKEAVPSMPSNLCAILLAVDLMVASMISAVTIDKFGRKVLMTYSSIGTGVFAVLMATQLQFHLAPHWVTAFFIYAYNFVFNLGACTVPFVVMSEVFLPEVRGLGNTLTMACMWIANFFTLIIFTPIVDAFGLGPLFYGFSVICFLAALYSQLFLPETKGLAADQIQLMFLKKGNKI